jgi:hypothetical protein
MVACEKTNLHHQPFRGVGAAFMWQLSLYLVTVAVVVGIASAC